MRLDWLADVLREAGCRVIETPGWRTRGTDLVTVRGVVWHHTASSTKSSDEAVANLLVRGRSDLPGPLCQLGLQRDGSFVVVAAGRANHNGFGTWGNQSIGIEAYNNGVGEPWPAVQLDAYDRGTAAILRHLRLSTAEVKGHRETDPHRKIDPAGIDMDAARQRIAALLTYRPPAPTPQPEDDDMFTDDDRAKLDEVYAQLTTSRDDKSPKGATVRWLAATARSRAGRALSRLAGKAS